MASTIGQLLIELKANTDQFTKGIQSARDLSFTSSSEIANSFKRVRERNGPYSKAPAKHGSGGPGQHGSSSSE